jgi:tetratricopeptide (TPR) repeat protein
MPAKPNIAAFVFGGFALISVSYFMYVWWFPKAKKLDDSPFPKKTAVQSKTKLEEEEEQSESESEDEEDEDEEDDDEEEEAAKSEDEVVQLEVQKEPEPKEATEKEAVKQPEAPKEENTLSLKEQYDTAVRLASKFTAAQHNEKAIEKLTDAINLSAKVPSAQKDLLTLYNNRSALFEKTGAFDSSLRDISVVLTMDPHHIKARTRRGRVYEAQGKVQESLQDFVHATILERARGGEADHDRKITELSKRLAIERTPKTLKELRSSQAKKHHLPSKAYCRNFFEAYPSVYSWKNQFFGVSRESLSEAFQRTKREQTSNRDDSSLLLKSFESASDLMKFDFSNDCYKKAFETLHELPVLSVLEENKTEGTAIRSLLSFYHEMIGTEFHLLFQIVDASREFERAIELFPRNIDAQLKYNAVLLENGEKGKALELYSKLLSLLQENRTNSSSVSSEGGRGDDKSDTLSESFADARSSPLQFLSLESEKKELKTAYRAWIHNHRASLWVSRDENGYYASDAFQKAIDDIDQSIRESGKVEKQWGGNYCVAFIPFSSSFLLLFSSLRILFLVFE